MTDRGGRITVTVQRLLGQPHYWWSFRDKCSGPPIVTGRIPSWDALPIIEIFGAATPADRHAEARCVEVLGSHNFPCDRPTRLLVSAPLPVQSAARSVLLLLNPPTFSNSPSRSSISEWRNRPNCRTQFRWSTSEVQGHPSLLRSPAPSDGFIQRGQDPAGDIFLRCSVFDRYSVIIAGLQAELREFAPGEGDRLRPGLDGQALGESEGIRFRIPWHGWVFREGQVLRFEEAGPRRFDPKRSDRVQREV